MSDYLVFIGRGGYSVIEVAIDRIGYVPVVIPFKDRYDMWEFSWGYDYAWNIKAGDRVAFVVGGLVGYVGRVAYVERDVSREEFIEFLRENGLSDYIGFWKPHLDRSNRHVVASVNDISRFKPILLDEEPRHRYPDMSDIRELLKEYAVANGLVSSREAGIDRVEDILKSLIPRYKKMFTSYGSRLRNPYMRLLPNTAILDRLIEIAGIEPIQHVRD